MSAPFPASGTRGVRRQPVYPACWCQPQSAMRFTAASSLALWPSLSRNAPSLESRHQPSFQEALSALDLPSPAAAPSRPGGAGLEHLLLAHLAAPIRQPLFPSRALRFPGDGIDPSSTREGQIILDFLQLSQQFSSLQQLLTGDSRRSLPGLSGGGFTGAPYSHPAGTDASNQRQLGPLPSHSAQPA